jgi:hypothetical protein
MRYQRDLQAALRTRHKRLKDANAHQIHDEIRLVVGWIGGQPALRAILAFVFPTPAAEPSSGLVRRRPPADEAGGQREQCRSERLDRGKLLTLVGTFDQHHDRDAHRKHDPRSMRPPAPRCN